MEKYENRPNAATINDGLYKSSMGTQKKIDGAGRLGVHVRTAISKTLESHGLGHLPRELPPNQEDAVRLYLGSPIADVIKAVLGPSGKETKPSARSVPPKPKSSYAKSARLSAANNAAKR